MNLSIMILCEGLVAISKQEWFCSVCLKMEVKFSLQQKLKTAKLENVIRDDVSISEDLVDVMW